MTGGAGFIGSHTSKALAAQGWQPIAFDNLSRGHRELVQWGPLHQGDILEPRDLDRVFNRYQPKSVIHFAALAYVGESMTKPIPYYQNNVSGLINLLAAMSKYGASTLVFSSSCATYGIPDRLPIDEEMPQRPISPYGHSKLVCEQILMHVAAMHQLRFAVLRYFNACGADPDGELSERHDPETHLIPLAIDAATGRGPPLQIFGLDYPTADGSCERDFIHVSDLASAHIAALDYLDSGERNLTCNLGTGRAHSIMEIISAIEGVTGRPVPFTRASRRPGDPATLVADPSRAERLLDFKPRYSDLHTIIETTRRSRLRQEPSMQVTTTVLLSKRRQCLRKILVPVPAQVKNLGRTLVRNGLPGAVISVIQKRGKK